MAGDTGDMEDTYTGDTCHRTICPVILRVEKYVGVTCVTSSKNHAIGGSYKEVKEFCIITAYNRKIYS